MKPVLDKDTETVDPESLELLDLLIHNTVKGLQQKSYKPRIQDALKAIQLRGKVAKASEGEEIFWDLIEGIREDELPKMYPQTPSLEAQIQNTILGLKPQVKNGVLPVKIITDTLNHGKSEECRLTYHRVGRLLSKMGFRKAKTPNGCYAILWDDNLLSPHAPSNDERNENQSPAVGRAASPAAGSSTSLTALSLSKGGASCPTSNREKNEKQNPVVAVSPAASPAIGSSTSLTAVSLSKGGGAARQATVKKTKNKVQ